MFFSSTVTDYRCARIPAIRISKCVQLEECDALVTGGTDNALERDDNGRTAAAHRRPAWPPAGPVASQPAFAQVEVAARQVGPQRVL